MRHLLLTALAMLCLTGLHPAKAVEPEMPRDTVMASILVASPGPAIYQATGHAAIRLQCPAYGLDNVFSYETSTGDLAGQLYGQAKGRFASLTMAEYSKGFTDVGRGITGLPLNLTDPQIRRLWQILDETVESGEETDFNIRHNSCNSAVMSKIAEAIFPDRIVVESEDCLIDNGEIIRKYLQEPYPWACLVLTTGLGAASDETDSWMTRATPITMENHFRKSRIMAPGGKSRPMLAAEPIVIYPVREEFRQRRLTPDLLASLILLGVIILDGMDLAGRRGKILRIIDILLLSAMTLASLILIAVAMIPASIGDAWNWLFIPLNPLPAAVWLMSRKSHHSLCRSFFLGYSIACLLFVAAPLFTSQAALWSSLLSLAIALRVLIRYRHKPQQ